MTSLTLLLAQPASAQQVVAPVPGAFVVPPAADDPAALVEPSEVSRTANASDPIAPRYVDRRSLHRRSGPIAIDAQARRAYVAGLAFDLQDPLAPRDLGLAGGPA